MPGRHITDRQMKFFVTLKKTHKIEIAAAKAVFSRATGYRLTRDPSRPLSGKRCRGAGGGQTPLPAGTRGAVGALDASLAIGR